MLFTCLYIFLARLIDVTFGTVRTILTVQGKKKIAAMIAFIEVLIWFFVAREALSDVSSLWIPISYALGFSLGTYIGTYITGRFIDGFIGLQVITKNNNDKLINSLRNSGYGVSVVDLKKTKDSTKKDMLIIETRKRSLNKVMDIVKKNDNKAFVIINETRLVHNGLIK